ncbi:MAG: class D sortase [Thermoanaerobaculia bacterium]
MSRAPKWLRRAEILLWTLGLSLLGVALGATVQRWNWQEEQERALVASANAAREVLVPAPTAMPAPEPEPGAKPEREPEPDLALDRAVLGRLEIPRLDVTAIVRAGDDEKTLARAVGWLPGTPAPGEGGNTALAGHRDTFFRPLRRIEIGDRIRLVVPPETFEYRVESLKIVEPDDVSVLESHGREELTLITCYPIRFVGPAPDRFIVKAVRVEKEQM